MRKCLPVCLLWALLMPVHGSEQVLAPSHGRLLKPGAQLHLDLEALRSNPWLRQQPDAVALHSIMTDIAYLLFGSDRYETVEAFKASARQSGLSFGSLGSISLFLPESEEEEDDLLPFLTILRFTTLVPAEAIRFPAWQAFARRQLNSKKDRGAYRPVYATLAGKPYLMISQEAVTDPAGDVPVMYLGFADEQTLLFGTRQEVLDYATQGPRRVTPASAAPFWIALDFSAPLLQEERSLMSRLGALYTIAPVLLAIEMGEVDEAIRKAWKDPVSKLKRALKKAAYPMPERAVLSVTFPGAVRLKSKQLYPTREGATLVMTALKESGFLQALAGSGTVALVQDEGLRLARCLKTTEYDAFKPLVLLTMAEAFMAEAELTQNTTLKRNLMAIALRLAEKEEDKRMIRAEMDKLAAKGKP